MTTPLFKSDRSRDAKWREVLLRATLNTDSGTLLMRRAVAGCARSPSLGPKWRPYQPRLAVTGRGKGLGQRAGEGRGYPEPSTRSDEPTYAWMVGPTSSGAGDSPAALRGATVERRGREISRRSTLA